MHSKEATFSDEEEYVRVYVGFIETYRKTGVGKACAGHKMFILSSIFPLITWIFSPVLILGATDPTGSWKSFQLHNNSKCAIRGKRRMKTRNARGSDDCLPKHWRWVSLSWADEIQVWTSLAIDDNETVLCTDLGTDRANWFYNDMFQSKKIKSQLESIFRKRNSRKKRVDTIKQGFLPEDWSWICLCWANETQVLFYCAQINRQSIGDVDFRSNGTDWFWIWKKNTSLI